MSRGSLDHPWITMDHHRLRTTLIPFKSRRADSMQILVLYFKEESLMELAHHQATQAILSTRQTH